MTQQAEPEDGFGLRPIDYMMVTLEDALKLGLTLEEVVELGDHAQSIADLDYAILLYGTQDIT